MRQYLDLVNRVLGEGTPKDDRTGTGTLSVFGHQMRFDLAEGFPFVTTKRVNFDAVKGEYLWMLSGSTNANECADKYGFKIWRKWADESGDLGPVYGEQWRRWKSISGDNDDDFVMVFNTDQIKETIHNLRVNPDSRRHLISAWNPGEVGIMALPPCHFAFQFYVSNGRLSCMVYQRSGDVFLGVPFNIAGYAMLTHMIAQVTGLEVGELVHTLGDAHVYRDHIEQLRTQVEREPKPLPALYLNPLITDIDDFGMDDIGLADYESHGKLTGKVSV